MQEGLSMGMAGLVHLDQCERNCTCSIFSFILFEAIIRVAWKDNSYHYYKTYILSYFHSTREQKSGVSHFCRERPEAFFHISVWQQLTWGMNAKLVPKTRHKHEESYVVWETYDILHGVCSCSSIGVLFFCFTLSNIMKTTTWTQNITWLIYFVLLFSIIRGS